MNHCRKCQSDYEKPGTCNCFAALSVPAPLPVYPWNGPVCPRCGPYLGLHSCPWTTNAPTITWTITTDNAPIWYNGTTGMICE